MGDLLFTLTLTQEATTHALRLKRYSIAFQVKELVGGRVVGVTALAELASINIHRLSCHWQLSQSGLSIEHIFNS